MLPPFHRKGIPHRIELEEYTNLSLPMMLMAGAMGMPFIPVKDMLGTDLLKYKSFMGENKYKIIESPFAGETTLLVPALNPDVAIIHVQQADEYGNAQIWGIGGDCKYGANAAKQVIVCCERICRERSRSSRTIYLHSRWSRLSRPFRRIPVIHPASTMLTFPTVTSISRHPTPMKSFWIS